MKETLTERMRHAAAHVELYDQEWEAQQLRDGAAEIERLEAEKTARWEDGEPANLVAAAADAYEWLIVFERFIKSRRTAMYLEPNDSQRLGRCIAALRKFFGPSQPDAAP